MRQGYRVSTIQYLATPHHLSRPPLPPGTHHHPLHRTTRAHTLITNPPMRGTGPLAPATRPNAPLSAPAPTLPRDGALAPKTERVT